VDGGRADLLATATLGRMPVPRVPHRPARRTPTMPPPEPYELAAPPAPPPPGPGLISGVLPAVSTLPILVLGGTGHAHGTALLLGVLIVPTVGGTVAVHVASRRRQRRVASRLRGRWQDHLAAVSAAAAAAAEAQRLALDRLHPADLLAAATAAPFERRPTDDDALVVVVGTGPVPARRPVVRARHGPLEEIDPFLAAAADRAAAASAVLPAAPVVVDLGRVRVLAVVGGPSLVRPVLLRLVAELAVLHAPGELALGGALGPLATLPHVRGAPTTPDGLVGWVPETPLAVAVVASFAPGDRLPDAATLVGCATTADVPASAGAVLDVAERTLYVDGGDVRLDAVDTFADCARLCAVLGAAAPGLDRPTPDLAALLARPRGQELEVPIGLDPSGEPVLLRLAESALGGDGPHGLLVGATGSGKSVLLRTVVAGLAARHPPAELGLLLVDYKGGAAFAELAALPHVGGLVTNLADDPWLLRRVALALGAELERRQRVLRAAGLESRRALVEAGGSLPSLLVAVDEAGELLAADPELATVFARVGRVGRSLGVHLLLATQHWDAGRLHTLDTHLRYRLCLRTFTADDSRAVLGTDAASRLPVRSGAGYVAVDGVTRRVDVLPPPADPTALVPAWEGRAEAVWLPPLPTTVSWPGDGSIGLLDRPAERSQPPLVVDLDGAGGHAAVVGGPRSGVTTALRAVVHALCADRGPSELQVHVLDLAGGLGDLADLPQVGTVARLHEAALVRAVVLAVRSELAVRAAGSDGPRLVLVVDGIALLRSDDGILEAALTDLAARGLAHDVHLLVGGRRWSDLRGGLFDAVGTRLELRLGDPSESLAGRLRAAVLPRDVPGRGLLPDGTELQLAVPDGSRLRSWPGRTPAIALLPSVLCEPAGGRRFVLGAGGPAGAAVELDLLAPGRHLVVSGDTGSGRTTVLRRLIRHLARTADVEVDVVDPRRGLLAVAPLVGRWSHAPDAAAAALSALTAVLQQRLPGDDPAAAPTAGPPHVVVLDDADLLDSGPLGAWATALTQLAALMPYAPEIGLHLVVARPAAHRSLDPLAQRLRGCAPWTLQLPGEHLEGPAAGRAAPTVVGRGLLARGSAPAVEVQCYLDGGTPGVGH
jgi:S-DNA-T family DNA segregation ATPase FtsK/SpoIIIE